MAANTQWDWQAEQLDAEETLREDGVVLKFVRTQKGQLDPITGEYKKVKETVFEVPSLIKMYHAKATYAQSWMPEITVQATDEVILLSAKSYKPLLGDTVTLYEDKYTIAAVSTFQPAMVPLLYYVLARKG